MISNLDGSLGLDIFSTLRMKGHVLHGAPAHLKVPGCSLIRKALLTNKLSMFLLRSYEIIGGCEKTIFKPFYSNGAVEWNGKADTKTMCRTLWSQRVRHFNHA